MSSAIDRGLHVVFGTGQVGSALVTQLASTGHNVRAVSQRAPTALADGADWRSADVADAEAATDAAKGATVIYQEADPLRSGLTAMGSWSRLGGGCHHLGLAVYSSTRRGLRCD